MNKSGVSDVVATVLIIALTILAVSVVWVGVMPLIRNSLGVNDVCTNVDVSIATSGGYTCYQPNGITAVRVAKGAKESNISALKFYLLSNGNSIAYTKDVSLGKVSAVSFFLNSSTISKIDRIEVVPVVKSGNTVKDCSATYVSGVSLCGSAGFSAAEIAQAINPTNGSGSGTGGVAIVGPLNFIDPTPSNGANLANRYFIVNVSASDSQLKNLTYGWNGVNYSYYSDSLVLMYNFDNNSAIGESGAKVVDVSKYGNNGTINNVVAYTSSGKYNGAFNFNNGYVDAGNSGSLQLTSTGALSAWVKTGSMNVHQVIFGKLDWAIDRNGYSLSIENKTTGCGGNSGALMLEFADASNFQQICFGSNLNDNQYHHVAAVWDSNVRLYIDGVQVGTAVRTITPISNVYTLWIGDSHIYTLGKFYGSIDEARVYNRSLSPSEVSQLYMSNLQKYNATQWYLMVNQSGLSVGIYNYQACMFNNSNYQACTEQRSINII